ncbi:hypothetical protein Tco_0237886 [Tanacetum coccineum]
MKSDSNNKSDEKMKSESTTGSDQHMMSDSNTIDTKEKKDTVPELKSAEVVAKKQGKRKAIECWEKTTTMDRFINQDIPKNY